MSEGLDNEECLKHSLEYRIINQKTYEERRIYAIFNIERDIRGRAISIIGAVKDITDEYMKDEESRYMDKALLATIQNSDNAVSVHNSGFRILYQNEMHIKLYGYSIGRICYEKYHSRKEPCEDCQQIIPFPSVFANHKL